MLSQQNLHTAGGLALHTPGCCEHMVCRYEGPTTPREFIRYKCTFYIIYYFVSFTRGWCQWFLVSPVPPAMDTHSPQCPGLQLFCSHWALVWHQPLLLCWECHSCTSLHDLFHPSLPQQVLWKRLIRYLISKFSLCIILTKSYFIDLLCKFYYQANEFLITINTQVILDCYIFWKLKWNNDIHGFSFYTNQ